jgi:hypothetical protein
MQKVCNCIWLAYFLALKMEAVCSFETLETFYCTTQCVIIEYTTIHIHCCENLKFVQKLCSVKITSNITT